MALTLRDGGAYRRPYDDRGLFVSKACPDPNCDGHLVIEEDRVYGQVWRCNGLTHEGPDGPLVACNHSHLDGPCRQ
jgi:hypothetical protein